MVLLPEPDGPKRMVQGAVRVVVMERFNGPWWPWRAKRWWGRWGKVIGVQGYRVAWFWPLEMNARDAKGAAVRHGCCGWGRDCERGVRDGRCVDAAIGGAS